ncbi:MAG TPA: response regulator, partial [Puia sp.]|nr:response regulator [Puia sp.]
MRDDNPSTPGNPSTSDNVITAVIIDDEPLARLIVQEYLQSFPEIKLLQECNDGFEGLKAIQQFHPDLIFLDIQMPKINGFEMLELVEDPPAVIFTTAFDEYAIRAFETHAVDYLLKPFSKDRFDKALRKWLAQHADHQTARAAAADETKSVGDESAAANPAAASPANQQSLLDTAAESPTQQQRIVVKTGGKIKIIPLDDV